MASISSILSLHPHGRAERGEAGKAWILKIKQTTLNPSRTRFEAYKGTYEFFTDAFFADSDSRSTPGTSVAKRIASSLRRRTSQASAADTEFFEQGRTLHFRDDLVQPLIAHTRLSQYPPPSFRFHTTEVAKPSAETIKAKVASAE